MKRKLTFSNYNNSSQNEEPLLTELVQMIKSFNESLKAQLPAIKYEINRIIKTKCTDTKIIETYLDTLLPFVTHGIGEDLFVRLVEYYRGVDAEGANFYWKEYKELQE